MRKEGYYWCKLLNRNSWSIEYYSSRHKAWFNNEYKEYDILDKDFKEIDERKIVRLTT